MFNRNYMEREIQFRYRQIGGTAQIKKSLPPTINIYDEITSRGYEDKAYTFFCSPITNTEEEHLKDEGFTKNETVVSIQTPHKELRDCGLALEDGSLLFKNDDLLILDGQHYLITHINRLRPLMDGIHLMVQIWGRKTEMRA